jgi:putative ABC transport system permease protein
VSKRRDGTPALTATLAVCWYRFRVTLRRRVAGYLGLVVLIALLGGVALGSLAAARRTQSSFPAFLAGTNPSDLFVNDFSATNTPSIDFAAALARLPHVEHVASWGLPNVLRLGPDGKPFGPNPDLTTSGVFTVVSTDGLYRAQDRATLSSGRWADPSRSDEAVMSAPAARVLGVPVGGTLRLGFYTDAASNRPNYETDPGPAVFEANIKVVGIVTFNREVVQDDIDQFPTYVLLSPRLAPRLKQCCGEGNGVMVGLQLDHGSRSVPAVESEIGHALPQARITALTSSELAKAERAIEPASIALAVFGLIAALATLLVAGQVIGRQLRSRAAERAVLRGFGASPSATVLDPLVGITAAIVAGACAAALVAALASPLAPIGVVRSVEVSPGIALDWTVLGGGTAALIVALGAVAAALALYSAPHRVAARARMGNAPRRSTALGRIGTTSGLSPSAATGIRFAIEPGSGTNAAPVRSAILGGALAMAVVIATVVFGASLNALVSRPSLYGWNWDYELRSAYAGVSNIPLTTATRVLARDPNIEAWSGVYFVSVRIDGLTVPALATAPGAAVGPSRLSGQALRSNRQALLGAATLAQLRKHVGDSISVAVGPKTYRLTVVGTVALPAVGVATDVHTDLATGAVLPTPLLPESLKGFGDHDGPEAILLRLRHGVNAVDARRRLARDAARILTHGSDGPVSVVTVQRPAEIVNYRTMGSTPALLGLGLAAGAVTALLLTLVASVRRRQRDLALLKTIGFTRRQLASVVLWQSVVAVALGTLGGVPCGVIAGRFLWDRFSNAIHVVPDPTVPAATIALVVAGAVVLAYLVAAWPGREAARTPAALLLHRE